MKVIVQNHKVEFLPRVHRFRRETFMSQPRRKKSHSPQFFGVALFGSTLQAAVLGRAGPGERFLAVPRQAESPLSPRGVYFIIRRSERLERTRRREGFDAAPPMVPRLFSIIFGRKLVKFPILGFY